MNVKAETATSTGPNFRYWNSVDPAHFLEHDWQNPSRQWATGKAIAAAGRGDLLEVGPGPGVDYERHFRAELVNGLRYHAYEGSQSLYDALRKRFPETDWHLGTIADLSPLSADVVYARHVMEHQPSLEPALSLLLGAARHVAVITWYRPPGPSAFSEYWEGVHCHTFKRADTETSIEQAGFRIAESQSFTSGDEAWVLVRQ